MKKNELKGYFQITSFVIDSAKTFSNTELLEAMDLSQVHNFGWPIGLVLHGTKHAPISKNDGIVAEIISKVFDDDEGYDFWKLTQNANFYTLLSLFEDRRTKSNVIFFDSRINRTTEALMRIGRLYSELNFPENVTVACELEYGGLQERTLSVANPRRLIMSGMICNEKTYTKKIVCSLSDLLEVKRLKQHVSDYLIPFFSLFGFFKPERNMIEEIVDAYYHGRIT